MIIKSDSLRLSLLLNHSIHLNAENSRIYYYKLEDINIYGNSTMHGSVSAMQRRVNKIGR